MITAATLLALFLTPYGVWVNQRARRPQKVEESA